MEEITMSSANNDLKSSKPNTGQQPREVEDESSISYEEEDDGDTLSLSDHKDTAFSNPNTPFNLDYSFEFFTGPTNPKRKANSCSSKAGDIMFFGTPVGTPAPEFNQEQGREEQEDGKGSSPDRKTSTNPFEDEEEEVVAVIESRGVTVTEENSQRNPNDVLLPLSSARLLNEVILSRATITTSFSSPTRPSSPQLRPPLGRSLTGDVAGGDGGYTSKKKQNKVLFGLARIAPKMELGGHKKNKQIKNRHSGQPAAPLLSAVVPEDGGTISSGGVGRSACHVRTLRSRCGSRLANVLTKASFGCIRVRLP